MSSHATAPAVAAHKYPARPHPITTAAAATANRMTASVTISDPYCVHRSTPASAPSRVACAQNPATPTLSSPTDSQRPSTNSCRLHSGELPAITTAATVPIIPATRSGWVRWPATIWVERTQRTSRVVSCRRPWVAPVAMPSAPQNTANIEKQAGGRSRAAR
ncbi:Uncharacterised protein [Mycobacterium tuberculosis]|nr:Uncharacterised protein [Mycobacterium tuberculosis]CMH82800.1 Uncharacterised protein [Mycobacterium tuberculosis]CNW44491.1 Uncharacterised protein [Mycobacterium tuberculosis]CNW75457.1 Uncharacterised protein [Mycobacterium tuberculosis]CNX11020.1 Uncharacterised protein [Mycobacterium tuberculosis]